MKKLITLCTALVAVLIMSTMVAAVGEVDIDWVKINGDRVDDENIIIDLGEKIDIRMRMTANEDVEDVEVQARIIGYEYNDRETLIDITRPFDLDANETDTVELDLEIPVLAEKDKYELRIQVDGPRDDFADEKYTLVVEGPETGLRVRDIAFSPRGEVMAGRALLTQVRLENIGEDNLDDIKVIVDIPGLGVSGEVFLDEELEGAERGRGDKDITEEVFIRVPKCAEPDLYDVDVIVEFDEYDRVTATDTIRVVEGETCPDTQPQPEPQADKIVITPPPIQDVTAGQAGASYPVVITNMGTSAKTVMLSVKGVDAWGSAEITDAAPIVESGQTKTVYIYVSANEDASVGQKVFSLEITKDSSKQNVALTANVVEGEEEDDVSSIRRGLEIGVIVLIVLLIVLGLIIGLTRRKDRDDDDMKSQTYY